MNRATSTPPLGLQSERYCSQVFKHMEKVNNKDHNGTPQLQKGVLAQGRDS